MLARSFLFSPVFFFNDTATTQIYTLSLHDALPISFNFAGATTMLEKSCGHITATAIKTRKRNAGGIIATRSEEHTSELQSHSDLVCRLLLEKKKKKTNM